MELHVLYEAVGKRWKPMKSIQKKKADGPATPTAYAAKQRKLYSGDTVNHMHRKERQQTTPALLDLVPQKHAVESLERHGFLTKPAHCRSCASGGLHGPFERPGRADSEQLHWRCDEPSCRSCTNVLSGCTWLRGVERFRRLQVCVELYCKKTFPRRIDVFCFKSSRIAGRI